jgi:hypothetical protein
MFIAPSCMSVYVGANFGLNEDWDEDGNYARLEVKIQALRLVPPRQHVITGFTLAIYIKSLWVLILLYSAPSQIAFLWFRLL